MHLNALISCTCKILSGNIFHIDTARFFINRFYNIGLFQFHAMDATEKLTIYALNDEELKSTIRVHDIDDDEK